MPRERREISGTAFGISDLCKKITKSDTICVSRTKRQNNFVLTKRIGRAARPTLELIGIITMGRNRVDNRLTWAQVCLSFLAVQPTLDETIPVFLRKIQYNLHFPS